MRPAGSHSQIRSGTRRGKAETAQVKQESYRYGNRCLLGKCCAEVKIEMRSGCEVPQLMRTTSSNGECLQMVMTGGDGQQRAMANGHGVV
jgi:hypothetical protein